MSILPFLYAYLSVILGAFITTVILIFLGLSYGDLPELYLTYIARLQKWFPAPDLPRRKRYIDVDQSTTKGSSNSLELSLEHLTEGVNSISQGDFASAFYRAPSDRAGLSGLHTQKTWTRLQKVIFYLTLAFRFSFLFPVRFMLFLSSFAFVSTMVILAAVKKLTDIQKTWIAIVYCRLFCSGLGVITRFHNEENRPQRPGVAISNHLSPNDIQILFTGTPHGSSYGYVVTGQKHVGIIGIIEALVEKLCPSIWLERKNIAERQNFLSLVLDIAKTNGPVLLFPEGYCSNNTQVLQFRKAIFEEGINIYPIAIKQDANFGDGFWYEPKFHYYLLRAMCSWAIVYDIYYLEKATRLPDEDNSAFAKRMQQLISEKADIPYATYGGSMFYRADEREKLKNHEMTLNARKVETYEYL